MMPSKPGENKCNTCKYKFSNRDCITTKCDYVYYLDEIETKSDVSLKINIQTNGEIIHSYSDRDLSYFLDDVINRCYNHNCDNCPIPHNDLTCNTHKYLTDTRLTHLTKPYFDEDS